MGERVEMMIGGYGQPGQRGILRCAYQDGRFEVTDYCDGLRNPSWVLPHPEKPVLYAVEELSPEGRIVALTMADGHLRPAAGLPTGGADPCHISMTPDGRHLLVANYTGGSLAAFALDGDGMPVERTDFRQHAMAAPGANPARQEGPHVHFTQCRDGEVYVCDLGMDAVLVYGWDAGAGRLSESARAIGFPAGSGPRHLAFGGGMLYVLCELDATLHVFRREGGDWRRVQTARMVDEDAAGFGRFAWSAGAAIHFAPDGTLWTSVRGCDTLAAFDVGADGLLTKRGNLPSGGRTPRDFLPAGEVLFVANQDSDAVVALRPDSTGDALAVLPAIRPTCVRRMNA